MLGQKPSLGSAGSRITYLHVVQPVLTFGPQALDFFLEIWPIMWLGMFSYSIYYVVSSLCLESAL